MDEAEIIGFFSENQSVIGKWAILVLKMMHIHNSVIGIHSGSREMLLKQNYDLVCLTWQI